jgi:protoheme IX farnesyltransferase
MSARFEHIVDYWRLCRPRILAMVLLSEAVGAIVVAPRPMDWIAVAHALVGTGCTIIGAIALNQRLEHRSDAQMGRTAGRPLPAGRLGRREVTWFGAVMSLAGLVYLMVVQMPLPLVGLTLISWAVYVWIYTPLKAFSPWQTPVGAVAGAMPVLLGASAVGSTGNPVAWGLAAVVYLWQFPHAMAIAWLWRDELAVARLQVATVVDPSGRLAGRLAAGAAAALIPTGILLCQAARLSTPATAGAIIAGIAYLAVTVTFWRSPDDRRARLLLRASLVYLLVVLLGLPLAR